MLCSDGPTYPPSRETICLRDGVDGNGLILHSGERSDADMFGSVVENMLVDFVRDGDDPPFETEVSDEL
jgi:hypothetical protein